VKEASESEKQSAVIFLACLGTIFLYYIQFYIHSYHLLKSDAHSPHFSDYINGLSSRGRGLWEPKEIGYYTQRDSRNLHF